jgi:PIN domain nuclease of toxin-antitoxin system
VTTVLDACAVLALLRGEPAAARVRDLIEAGDATLTALGVAEVLDHLVRVVGAPEEDAVLTLAQLGLATPAPVPAAFGLRAGLLRARHYHRTARAVSLADCVAAEAARALDAPLATADPHLLDLCHAEAIAHTPLPDSDSHTWSPPAAG